VTSYPIDTVLPALKEALRTHSAVVLHAPPGAGKTTRVPLALLDILPPKKGRIVMLEPRRIAAVSAARWMAQTLGEQPGETVGYAIRFDARISDKTRIEVVTEGVLTRRIQADPGLEGTALVIFDEFHERGIHADLALALCLDIRSGLRENLKLLVMSATLDHGPIASLLGNAAVITSSGKSHPVQERYIDNAQGPVPARVAAAVRTALRETDGDLLVFLPGAGEIRACVETLQETFSETVDGISLHALYGDLPFEEQERAIMPLPNKRKIVLATNIAETSLTIQGVQVVIDSGLTRMLQYDPMTGMNRLVTGSVSRASAEQRKGRAGRLGPGVCYRLYSSHDLKSLPAFSQPEILVSELSQFALELAVWGVNDPASLSWLDRPPPAAWESAQALLRDIGAIDQKGSATQTGREMVRLPLHPRLSRLLIRARELGCLRLGADLAALLTERDIFRHRAGGRVIDDPDISARLDALRQRRTERATDMTADASAMKAVERTSRQLLRLLPKAAQDADDDKADHGVIARLLLAAYPDRICKRRDEGGRVFIHVQGRGVRLSSNSSLVSSPYIVAVAVDAGEKAEGFVHLAAPVKEELIRSECSRNIKKHRRVEWDRKEGRIVAALEERLGALLLSSRPFVPSDEEAGPILCNAVRDMPGMLNFSSEARQFQARVAMVRRAFPEEAWPDISDETLLSRPEDWLLPWLGGVRSANDLGGVKQLPALKARLSREQLRQVEDRTPLAILVPSGSRIAIDYTAGDLPVLAVKLQELFGLADTPLIAGGRIKILLHLLSPARRPVQVTQDLKGFWSRGYEQVKKELKGRYPKHPWPDDPWKAVPTKRTKPRGT